MLLTFSKSTTELKRKKSQLGSDLLFFNYFDVLKKTLCCKSKSSKIKKFYQAEKHLLREMDIVTILNEIIEIKEAIIKIGSRDLPSEGKHRLQGTIERLANIEKQNNVQEFENFTHKGKQRAKSSQKISRDSDQIGLVEEEKRHNGLIPNLYLGQLDQQKQEQQRLLSGNGRKKKVSQR